MDCQRGGKSHEGTANAGITIGAALHVAIESDGIVLMHGNKGLRRDLKLGAYRKNTLWSMVQSQAFREMSAATSDGTMVFDVFSSADSETRHFAAYPTDSNFHDRLDDGGGSNVPGCRMDGPQPCPNCLRR